MVKLNTSLRYYIHDRTNNDPLWQKLKFRVIFSDWGTPGEGEHKLMNFLRIQRAQPEYDPNTKHMLYGADADLIHLGLATHETHFHILREVVLQKEEKKKDPWEQFEDDKEESEEEEVKAKPFQFINIGTFCFLNFCNFCCSECCCLSTYCVSSIVFFIDCVFHPPSIFNPQPPNQKSEQASSASTCGSNSNRCDRNCKLSRTISSGVWTTSCFSASSWGTISCPTCRR